MAKKQTFNARSMNLLRKAGYIVNVVERDRHAPARNGQPEKFWKADLFGCFDLLAVNPDQPGATFVQVTSLGHLSDRTRKVLGTPAALICLRAGNTVLIHGWGFRVIDGQRERYCKVQPITAADFESEGLVTAADVIACTKPRKREDRKQGKLFI